MKRVMLRPQVLNSSQKGGKKCASVLRFYSSFLPFFECFFRVLTSGFLPPASALTQCVYPTSTQSA